MGGKLMTNEQYDQIVSDRLVFGKPVKQIAEEIGRKETVVFNVISAFNAVKEKDWNRCVALLTNQNFPLNVFIWAGERLKIEIPPSLEAAYNQRRAEVKRRELEKAKQSAAVNQQIQLEELKPQPEPPKPEKLDNTSLYLLKLLEAINQQNELLSQLMDAVIPKYVGDLKDNVNANCDSLFNQIKDNGEKLEAIKINSRKRGL